jgi:hypothetical protein
MLPPCSRNVPMMGRPRDLALVQLRGLNDCETMCFRGGIDNDNLLSPACDGGVTQGGKQTATLIQRALEEIPGEQAIEHNPSFQ